MLKKKLNKKSNQNISDNINIYVIPDLPVLKLQILTTILCVNWCYLRLGLFWYQSSLSDIPEIIYKIQLKLLIATISIIFA